MRCRPGVLDGTETFGCLCGTSCCVRFDGLDGEFECGVLAPLPLNFDVLGPQPQRGERQEDDEHLLGDEGLDHCRPSQSAMFAARRFVSPGSAV